ncbi:MAG TPA: hypothetical protein H9991_09955, partial [Candidatus Mailhella excrementigallinarum]|nr:hypothetical protein [Candidatus Mailhella excrementigallinarum]
CSTRAKGNMTMRREGGVISAPDAREPRSARNGHGPCGAAMRSASRLAPLAPPAVNVIFSTLL